MHTHTMKLIIADRGINFYSQNYRFASLIIEMSKWKINITFSPLFFAHFNIAAIYQDPLIHISTELNDYWLLLST